MRAYSAAEVRDLVLASLKERLRETGFEAAAVPDDLDLLESGVVDSMGLLEMISEVEERVGQELELEDLEPRDLTVLGRFCRQVERLTGS